MAESRKFRKFPSWMNQDRFSDYSIDSRDCQRVMQLLLVCLEHFRWKTRETFFFHERADANRNITQQPARIKANRYILTRSSTKEFRELLETIWSNSLLTAISAVLYVVFWVAKGVHRPIDVYNKQQRSSVYYGVVKQENRPASECLSAIDTRTGFS